VRIIVQHDGKISIEWFGWIKKCLESSTI